MKPLNTDTIAAISTPIGEGGIGVIRISGTDSLNILKRVFLPKKVQDVLRFKSHQMYYGDITAPETGNTLDEVLVTFMKGPHSYTGEDMVEVYCHGGVLVLKKVLEAIFKNGARVSEPGEFTKRAFLNGRLDLAQAEAVIDIIRAKTDLSLDAAQKQLKGSLSREVDTIKEGLVNLLAHIEAELDFPEEEDVGKLSTEEIRMHLSKAKKEVDGLLSTYEEGRVLREGLKVIILGRPNAGKSSLLNVLLKEERAIVTPIPGTTRDVIEEVVNIRGIPLRLMDTAGLREAKDEVEAIGVKFTRERLKEAQLVLYVVDTNGGIEEDKRILAEIKYKKFIIVMNKVDLVDSAVVEQCKEGFKGFKSTAISALYEEGIEGLKTLIYEEAMGHPLNEREGEIVVTQLRHKNALNNSLEAINRASAALEMHLPREFLAIELRDAVERLGELTGEVTTEDILDRIFSQFCVGK